jgi:hypothetical protein
MKNFKHKLKKSHIGAFIGFIGIGIFIGSIGICAALIYLISN